jgi:hypothetical protein
MKESELRKHEKCSYCGADISHETGERFYTIDVSGHEVKKHNSVLPEIGRDVTEVFQYEGATMCVSCWGDTPTTIPVVEDGDPDVVHVLQAALFTEPVAVGDVNPENEADYDGYERVMFRSSDTANLEPVEFSPPKGRNDSEFYVAVLDGNNIVVGVGGD